jgi:hypothetical protein
MAIGSASESESAANRTLISYMASHICPSRRFDDVAVEVVLLLKKKKK